MITAPRYEPRELPPEDRKNPLYPWALWDTISHAWVSGGGQYRSREMAEHRAAQHSVAWERSQRSSDMGIRG